jgi:hypothetical protein
MLAPAVGRNKGALAYKSVSKAKEAFVLPSACDVSCMRKLLCQPQAGALLRTEERIDAMSWSDTLKEAVGNVVGEAKQTVWPELMKKVLGDEGLQTMLAKLKDAGFQARQE